MKIRVATRASKLALAQTRWVIAQLRSHHRALDVEEVHVVTRADKQSTTPLAAMGGKGVFVHEVEAVVQRGEADLAVHSLKDVPGDVDFPDGLGLVCVPPREDPADVLVTEQGIDLGSLPSGSRVGTSSMRRACQLRLTRPDLRYEPIRGNVDTRLRKLEEGPFDAVVLAAAGLKRLGLWESCQLVRLPVEQCLPSVGQGTLALEGRMDDGRLQALVAPLEHLPSRLVTEAERAFLRRLEGSCHTPVAGHAQIGRDGRRLTFEALVASVEGERTLTASSGVYLPAREGQEPLEAARKLGAEVAQQLLDQGARQLMNQAEAWAAQQAHTPWSN